METTNKKMISLSIDPVKLVGKCLDAIGKNEKVNVTLFANEQKKEDKHPDYVSFSDIGLAAWIKEQKEKPLKEEYIGLASVNNL